MPPQLPQHVAPLRRETTPSASRSQVGKKRRGTLVSLLSTGVMLACGAPRPAQVPPQTVAAEDRAPRDFTESLERLERSVAQVESASEPLGGPQLGGVVRALARSLEPLSHAGRLRLEEMASRLAGVPVRSLAQAGLIREALQSLLDTLIRVAPTAGTEREYREALRRVGAAREQLDDLMLVDDQKPRLNEALHAAANAVFLARGAKLPFKVPPSTNEEAVPLAPFSEQLAVARRRVADVARIPLMGSRLASARALSSLASMIEVADSTRRLTRQVEELRFQATRLERASETSPDKAGWIRAGLQSAVDALSLVNGGQRSPWIDEAQRAVAAIDERSATSFQRAALQDALRATVDAFAALTPCSSDGPSP